MAKQYFPTVGKIAFEGTSSKNPMAFRYYEPERVVKGRKMKIGRASCRERVCQYV